MILLNKKIIRETNEDLSKVRSKVREKTQDFLEAACTSKRKKFLNYCSNQSKKKKAEKKQQFTYISVSQWGQYITLEGLGEALSKLFLSG